MPNPNYCEMCEQRGTPLCIKCKLLQARIIKMVKNREHHLTTHFRLLWNEVGKSVPKRRRIVV